MHSHYTVDPKLSIKYSRRFVAPLTRDSSDEKDIQGDGGEGDISGKTTLLKCSTPCRIRAKNNPPRPPDTFLTGSPHQMRFRALERPATARWK
ncbi:hypothetical protein CDAR_407721 [Caerostris darwini]|uniref:Uncharacterized protein n=1 Tax=Caerostris darwini TaxID=1538125 RepID=A0AAV4Q1J3_9ARAC|nr:hypothetical protein CDAR_407721 [Caerostris darwini]